MLLSLLAAASGVLFAQQPSAEDAMRTHYESAQRLLSTSDKEQAAFEFQLFLSDALLRLADDHSRVGEFSAAVPLYETALSLAPNHLSLSLSYAEAAIAARDFARAKAVLQPRLAACIGTTPDQSCAKIHLLLGRALYGMADYAAAKNEFEASVAIDPNFESGYELGRAYLAISETKQTARIFAEMLHSFGDTALIHLEFGRAYGQADFPELAIEEFKTAMARDDALSQVHYCLGAAYLMRSGDAAFRLAEAQFRRELALHPDNALSYAQLGHIAVSRHDYVEAEKDLSRASQLDPRNPDSFLLLGEVYAQLDRPADAELALRHAVAATNDPSRNHYQIRGAHYQLGLLLIKSGHKEEAKQEMRIAQQLVIENGLLDRVNLAGKPIVGYQFPKAVADVPADPGAKAAARTFELQIAPAIADSYNNLGVVAATDRNFAQAVRYFEQAAAWNPKMEDLDLNWGKAAFAANQYRQAALCLGRYIQDHPQAVDARTPLGFSRFMIGDYAGAIAALAPVSAELDAKPLLAYAYADSLVRAGDYDAGVKRLQDLEQANPGLPVVHLAIARAQIKRGLTAPAEEELRKTLKLRPDDSEASLLLAQILFARHSDSEARALIAEVTSHHPGSDVLQNVARIELQHGEVEPAIVNLEAAVQQAPNSIPLHLDLAAAYERASRPQDAVRERDRVSLLSKEGSSSAHP